MAHQSATQKAGALTMWAQKVCRHATSWATKSTFSSYFLGVPKVPTGHLKSAHPQPPKRGHML